VSLSELFSDLYGLLETAVMRAETFIQAFVTSPTTQRDYLKLAVVLAITVILEIAARRNWRVRYGSRNFRVDMLYFVFYYGGFYHLFFFYWLYKALIGLTSTYAPWLQMNLLASMSPLMQIVVMVLVSDFVGYWNHRWKHSNKFLWSFHCIHHSQTKLTIVSNYRFHIVDETLLRLWLFIPFQILGTGIAVWLWLDFIMAWVLYLQHSEWDWSYGPFGRIFVSPIFHRQHHAKDRRLQNTNFSMLFAFWDDLFGTADRVSPAPKEHGLIGDPVPESWLGQLAHPFREILKDLRKRARAPEAAVAPPIGPAE
jgi:sterol desaturase/sphingolipid hydroxylase (fatty acid hydroxylase superfamily)